MRAMLSMLTVACFAAAPAMATGTIDCTIADANPSFDASATVGSGPGGHFSRLDGKLEITAKGVPDDIRKIEIKLDDLTQCWHYGNELKLRVYRDCGGSGPSAEVDLVIETKSAGKGKTEYIGGYVLSIAHVVAGEEKVVTIRGRARCTAG